MVRSTRRLILGFACSVTVVAGGIAAAVAASGSDPNPLAGLDGGPTTPAQTAPSSLQTQAFAAFRREPTAADALPSGSVEDFADTYAVKEAGANLALARRAKTAAGAVWAVPGNGQVCLVTNADSVPDGAKTLDASADGCAPDGDAAAGRLVLSTTYNGRTPAHEFVAGLVPDDVDAVTVVLSDGLEQRVPVHDDVYTFASEGTAVRSVEFSTADGAAVVVHP